MPSKILRSMEWQWSGRMKVIVTVLMSQPKRVLEVNHEALPTRSVLVEMGYL